MIKSSSKSLKSSKNRPHSFSGASQTKPVRNNRGIRRVDSDLISNNYGMEQDSLIENSSLISKNSSLISKNDVNTDLDKPNLGLDDSNASLQFYDSINSPSTNTRGGRADKSSDNNKLMEVEVAFEWRPVNNQNIMYLPPAAQPNAWGRKLDPRMHSSVVKSPILDHSQGSNVKLLDSLEEVNENENPVCVSPKPNVSGKSPPRRSARGRGKVHELLRKITGASVTEQK